MILYLKKNLKLRKVKDGAEYGCDGTIKINLMLGNVKISSICLSGMDIEEITPDHSYI